MPTHPQEILDRLENVKGPNSSGNYSALCPFHDDHTASFSFHPEKGWNCKACGKRGSLESLAETLGIESKNGKPETRGLGKIETVYDYLDEVGVSLFQTVRFDPKTFRQRHRDPGNPVKWIWGLGASRRVLYHLDELNHASVETPVYLAEGEKDANRLRGAGLLATCNPMGAGKWEPEYTQTLVGRHVIILPDNDEPGKEHARMVAAAINPVAASVKIITEFLSGLPAKADISDWLNDGGTIDELERMVAQTPEWAPSIGTSSSEDMPEFPVLESDPFPDPPDDSVYYGLAGDFCRIAAPHTEADPIALLSQFLVYFGSAVNRCSYFTVEADRHFMNEFLVIVGKTGKARKGTSAGYVRRIYSGVDAGFVSTRVKSGLSSGEGIIYHVRDRVDEMQATKGENGKKEFQETTIDNGVDDKRLLAEEGEFSSLLKMMGREGNTLSSILRNAWDGRPLEALTKNSRTRSEHPHISIVGHCTRDELKKHLTETEYANGFGNRFLWLCVQRSKMLPEGGKFHEENLYPIIERTTQAVEFARRDGNTEIKRDPEAAQYWRDIYPELSADTPGMLGAITARAEAHTMRLALIYAVLDCSPVIRIEHLHAAYCLWKYSFRSAQHIFGTEIGDSVADHIHAALKKTPEGMTGTQINDMFGGHKSPDTIARALAILRRLEIVVSETKPTGRRPKTVWRIRKSQV